MISTDGTIVAIATPLGEGGLGVVRLSGPDAVAIAEKIFRSKEKISTVPSHTIHHGWITNSSPRQKPGPSSLLEVKDLDPGFRRDDVDEVVAAVFRAPHSYTGEDVVEFSCHGSPVVLKEVVKLCEEAGARLAKPGEFTERAYTNGKLDLPQAEAVADLIHAQSSRARAAATEQLRGQLSMKINYLREQLITLLAHIEANLDFAEEEVPIIAREKITKSLDKIKKELDELLSTGLRGRLLREGVRVSFAGKPNVGKSSLFNAFLSQDRAIVTDVPGTTRDTLEEKTEWNGLPVVLTDTAGLRTTSDPVESEGTARAGRAHAVADVVVLVLDGSQAISEDDERIAQDLKDKTIVVALNKSDKKQLAQWKNGEVCVAVSAKTGDGLAALKDAVLGAVVFTNPENESAPVVTNLRHVGHLEETARRLGAARSAVERNESEEAMALDLRAALEELGRITGESVTEDVLSAIFRNFCIGK